MSVPWAGAGPRRVFRRRHWQLAMGLQLLLLVLLCRGWLWAWASGQARFPGGQPLLSVRVVNGSHVAVIVKVNVTVSSTGSPPFRPNGSQGRRGPSLGQTALFALSGCCGLVALCFLVRAFSSKIQPKKYVLLASDEVRAAASMDSDEEVVFDWRLY